ncbi:telomere-associated protein RIF1 [Cheilinus undulatus]|uniref:telomere-associated protein RIF1 n=1 Tax=Cheilinus undulatus TaxID=241271 RepID=UPI001BD4DD48|nr:telomere-associated protein RIF1 [Cheilinus undulatus]XP_041662651.1 telomere-associated protein RIF1 [Cheilinus undulatus]XP_041662653.1 telomere-associated protein RIF1 [Cheilinus undulatus]XP_041662654.1 telomere-associated protein RIF1 [Cheilinus undulatus]
MMATAGPPSSSSLLPLLESLEDNAAGQSEQTDAYLTIANRLSGEEGRQFLPAVEKHFSRLGKAMLAHMTSPNAELSQAALQALGFCVYHSHVVSGVPETLAAEILSALCSLVVTSTDKNTCTRALWVISKQSFPPDVVAKKVPLILGTLESVWSREDVQSVVMEHEALNVVIRMLEQVPAQMGDGAVRWAKLIIPLVVHSASKVRLRAAAAMEMGLPLLLQKQAEVAAIIEPMMSSKLIPELQKLFMSKNETNVLKLWPLFVKLLGKLLHRGGPFINSLLHLEELGFRSSSLPIKKIAFIAWKSLIDNFALNPDILCSSKRMKLLMQPLASINVRTEALLLTKVEVWWYLVVQLGTNLSSNFDQVSVPLLQCTIGSDSTSVPGTPSRAASQNGSVTPATPKSAGTPGFNSPANSSRMSLNSSVQVQTTFPSIQLLGLEMLLHYFLGPEVIATAAKNKIILSLEPLNHPFLSGASSFTKHAAVLISNIRDGFINIGKEAPDALLAIIWTNLVRFVNFTIESSSKKDRQGCEVFTLMLQALQSIVTSEALPAEKVLILFEATVKGLPQRVLGSASYQVGKMDVLNGTPALFLILLLYNSSMLPAYIEDERFFHCLQTLVGCGLSGHTSPLAFGEAVLGAIRRSAAAIQNKEQLWRMWSVMVGPLTETITQSNEVNQGDALEHNFSAMHSALLFPITHLLCGTPLQQASQKSMLSTWSKLYKVFARCSALVVTAEENICCEELCAKMTTAIDRDALKVPSTLNTVSSVLHVMVECVDFSPFTPQFQQKLKSPHTPVNWMKKRSKVLGNLTTFQSLLVQCLDIYLEDSEAPSETTGLSLVSIMSVLFSNLVLANTVTEALNSLIQPLTLFYQQAANEKPRFSLLLQGKLEKLLSDILSCLQTRSTLAYNSELLSLLSPVLCVVFPHKNKQLRTSVTQFWNATFANSVNLTYPEEIRPILSQVKQKTPIILPGFEVVSVTDEFSGPYSNESSQMETKLSGIPVSSVGKRDSLLGKASEMKERSSMKNSKPVSMKLDFGSPKLPRREVLEEEASIDFVFIPPETKERVLTEHQKEVKRTKRVDIPAMYNNLDASLDTTVFTQYSQSQEDSLDKLPTQQAENVTKEAPAKVPKEDEKKEEDMEVLSKDTQDDASPKSAETAPKSPEQEVMIPESADVSMEDVSTSDDKAEVTEVQSKDGASPNVSSSSDLVSGTPQKPNSRRQSFITLEKYAEGKSSPGSVSKFTGPLVKTSDSQESKTKASSSQASQISSGPNSHESQSTQDSQSPANNAAESPVRPKDSGLKCEPVRLMDRLPSNTAEDEDVIPDTQTEAEGKASTKMSSATEEMESFSQEEESQQSLNDSQSSDTSPGEPRRSGRQRVRPLRPGEDPEERDQKFVLKRKRSEGEPKGDSPKSSSVQSRPNTRSKNATEEDSGKDRLRTRAQRDKGESNQTNSQGRAQKKIKLFSNVEDFLDQPEPRRRSTRDRESSQNDLQSESQSQGRSSRRSTSSLDKADAKKKDKESSQTNLRSGSQSEQESQSQGRSSRRSRSSAETKKVSSEQELNQTATPELEMGEQPENVQVKPNNDSEVITFDPKSIDSQEFDFVEQTEKDDSQMLASSPPKESQDEPSTTSEPASFLEDENKTKEDSDGNLGQEDSQDITSSSLDSQSLRKSRRSKASSESVGQSPESENAEKAEKKEEDSQKEVSSQSTGSQSRTSMHKKMAAVLVVKDKTNEGTNVNLSQEDFQGIAPSSLDSQSLRKSRRSKASSDSVSQSHESEITEKADKKEEDTQKEVSSQNNGSQSRASTRNKLGAVSAIENKTKKDADNNYSQEDSQFITPMSSDSQSLRKSRRSKASSDSQQVTSPLGESQESQIVEKPKKEKADSQIEVTNESQDGTSLKNEPEVEDITKTAKNMKEDSQVLASSSDSQPLWKSRRSKALSEAAEPEDKSKSKDLPRRQSRSSSQTLEAVDHADTRASGRTRRSMAKEEQSKSSPSSTMEGSQSLESSQGRRSSRRSSQTLTANVESSGSESSQAKESFVSIKRGKKPQVSVQSPLTLESKEANTDQDAVMVDLQSSENQDLQTVEVEMTTHNEDSLKVKKGSESLQVASNIEEQNIKSPMEVEDHPQTDNAKISEMFAVSPHKEEQLKDKETSSSQETGAFKSAELSESVQISAEPSEQQQAIQSPLKTSVPQDEETEQPQVLESPEGKAEVSEPEDKVSVEQDANLDSNDQEQLPEEPAEDDQGSSLGQKDGQSEETEQAIVGNEITPLQDGDKDGQTQIIEQQVEEEKPTAFAANETAATVDAALTDVCSTSISSESTNNLENPEKLQGSPAKQKDLEAVMGQDVGQSPSGGRTRGSWSPSASPSTSILKKGQKRPLEDETPSPLVKSRRVSFANPIQQQEMADDIDRRSPALRTSSPRRSKGSSIPQPKYVTTPTKGMLILSPRNLHSPGYKSSKKCLISEMSQEPRPVSRDCIYPALVGCSTPVEAVLPQISSNMWSRGFGQLVRARNIKTVGDLSALTPSEIKTLPIRSPKISNVKKALKIYEQQRKGRGGDELKSFDETEMMTSELEETSAPQNHEEEDKTSAETLATELVDEPAETKPDHDLSVNQTSESSSGEQTAIDQQQSEGLLSEVEALAGRMTSQELGQCSSQQLVQIHDHLGGLMGHVVVELQTRLSKME